MLGAGLFEGVGASGDSDGVVDGHTLGAGLFDSEGQGLGAGLFDSEGQGLGAGLFDSEGQGLGAGLFDAEGVGASGEIEIVAEGVRDDVLDGTLDREGHIDLLGEADADADFETVLEGV